MAKPKIRLVLKSKLIYVLREEGVSCKQTPAPSPWEIDYRFVDDRGRVNYFKIVARKLTCVLR